MFKTSKGTTLQIIKLKGKDYLPVQQRIIWFREEKPNWSIETEASKITDTSALFKAVIRDEAGRVMATAHKSETKQGFADFIEKAETGSVGRAVALVGYGTQFAAELDEGEERIVDAPQETTKFLGGPETPWPKIGAPELHTYVIPFGKKFKGRLMTEVPPSEIKSYVEWLKAEVDKKDESPSNQVLDFFMMAEKYLNEF